MSLDATPLTEWAHRALAAAKQAGASSAEVGVSLSRALSVQVRMGELENLEFQRDRDLSLTVYFGQQVGSASTADLSADGLASTVAAACAIAQATGADPCMGLADADRLYTPQQHGAPNLDLYHPWALTPEHAANLARECEAAALAAHPSVSQSEGANVDSREGVAVMATSHGFYGLRRGSNHSLGCSVIARDSNDDMFGGYQYSSARNASDLWAAQRIGADAGQRAAARLGAKSLSTRSAAVLFTPEMARGLFGSLLGAISGSALYRKASYLLDTVGQSVMATHLSLLQNPFIPRASGAAHYDGEGVAAVRRPIVENGVLQTYLLGSYAARKLGLASTGNASGFYNIQVSGHTLPADSLLRELGTGLLVTSLMGQGTNTVTGDYSRGAEGFWVQNGSIAYPVQGITIAGNLRQMLGQVVAMGDDIDTRGGVHCGSLLIENMTIAGE